MLETGGWWDDIPVSVETHREMWTSLFWVIFYITGHVSHSKNSPQKKITVSFCPKWPYIYRVCTIFKQTKSRLLVYIQIISPVDRTCIPNLSILHPQYHQWMRIIHPAYHHFCIFLLDQPQDSPFTIRVLRISCRGENEKALTARMQNALGPERSLLPWSEMLHSFLIIIDSVEMIQRWI